MVPLVMELARPRSVVDVGCATGEWLSVFREYGVEDVWGVDGVSVPKGLLKIPEERFVPADLEQPFQMDRKFDLVVSLEVAEHLSSKCAETFVSSLVELGPLVLFSAAIPYQGGSNHVNLQWPEYWAKLFDDKGYVVTDPLRRKVWNNEEVAAHYAQNTLMFVARERLGSYPLLEEAHELYDDSMLAIVHPRMYQRNIEESRREAKEYRLKAKEYRLKAKEYRRLKAKESRYEAKEYRRKAEEAEAAKLHNVLVRKASNVLKRVLSYGR
jgi:SAM-dependent methyltransferase